MHLNLVQVHEETLNKGAYVMFSSIKEYDFALGIKN